MPTTIRSRLLLLMMSVLIPAIAAALLVIVRTYQAEREAVHQGLRDNARAVAKMLDRELAQRADLARAMSSALLLVQEPLNDRNLLFLYRWTNGIAQDLDGWVELRNATEVILDTRFPPFNPPSLPQSAVTNLELIPAVLPVELEQSSGQYRAQVVQPVHREGRTSLNLVIAVPQEALQRVVDFQRLPAQWIGTLIDSRRQVVARYPGGKSQVGHMASVDIVQLIEMEKENVAATTLQDGRKILSSFSTTPQGWTYLVIAPRDRNPIFDELPLAVVQLTAGALLLLALAVAAAAWVARGITLATESLKAMAMTMRAGTPKVLDTSIGIVEFDQVRETMSSTAHELTTARDDLERKVEIAIGRTRLAEQRVSQAQRIAALGRLTGGVAHDFNNLLGVISNSAHLIRFHVDHFPELQMPLDVILRAVETGSHLSQQLLRFGGRHVVSPRRVDLDSYLKDLCSLFQMIARQKVSVSVTVASNTDAVNVDASEMELALINLVLNARDAIADHGWLHVAARNALPNETEVLLPFGRYVLLTVSDNGAGMDEDQASHVFEPYFSTKGQGKGTGLGLSQVHGFCQQAGGIAFMSSTVGIGSTVSLLLPACRSDANMLDEAPGISARASVSKRALAGLRVLLVEDGQELAMVTTVLLESYGAVVEHVSNVDQAQARLAVDPPLQVVLSDVMMLGTGSGVDLAKCLRQSHPNLPVVLMSGYSDELVGLTDFTVLRKPVDPRELILSLISATKNVQPPAGKADDT